MKLISWNVNGLRACLTKGFMDFFTDEKPDIICLQETKMQREQAEIITDGYYQYWNSAEKKGYSGTAIFTNIEPISEFYGMGIEEHDKEGRMITLEFDSFYLVNVYVPNSKDGLLRIDYRMEWEDAFLAYVKKLEETKPVVICGDMNVAKEEIDLKNPKTNTKSAGFSIFEREKMRTLQNSGFIDSFRYFYPELTGAYSWWSYRANARKNNTGWRIDYFLLSQSMEKNLKSAKIYPEIYGSDHCPVGIELDYILSNK